jgi:hypothetical protein
LKSSPENRQPGEASSENAQDYRAFLAAAVVGLAMVGGLSLFLPDRPEHPADDGVVSVDSRETAQPVSMASPSPKTDKAMTAVQARLDTLTGQLDQGLRALQTVGADVKGTLSSLSEQLNAIQKITVERHQVTLTLKAELAEIHAELSTLAEAVQALKVAKPQLRTQKPRPAVSVPPFQIDAIDQWDELTYVAVSQQGRVAFLRLGEQQAGWTVTRIDRVSGEVGLRGPSGQTYIAALQR